MNEVFGGLQSELVKVGAKLGLNPERELLSPTTAFAGSCCMRLALDFRVYTVYTNNVSIKLP